MNYYEILMIIAGLIIYLVADYLDNYKKFIYSREFETVEFINSEGNKSYILYQKFGRGLYSHWRCVVPDYAIEPDSINLLIFLDSVHYYPGFEYYSKVGEEIRSMRSIMFPSDVIHRVRVIKVNMSNRALLPAIISTRKLGTNKSIMAFSSKEDAKTFAEELLFSEKSLSDKLKEWVRYNKLSKKEITEKFYI